MGHFQRVDISDSKVLPYFKADTLENKQKHVDAEGSIGVPAALVCGFALSVLASTIKDSFESDSELVRACPAALPLHYGQVCILCFTGGISMCSMVLSSAIWYIGSKLLSMCKDDKDWETIFDWWFYQKCRAWRSNSRFLFINALPCFVVSFILQPQIWCRQRPLAVLMSIVLGAFAAITFYAVRVPLPIGHPGSSLRKQYEEAIQPTL